MSVLTEQKSYRMISRGIRPQRCSRDTCSMQGGLCVICMHTVHGQAP